MDEVDRLLAVDQGGGSSDENRHVIYYSRHGHVIMDLGGEQCACIFMWGGGGSVGVVM